MKKSKNISNSDNITQKLFKIIPFVVIGYLCCSQLVLVSNIPINVEDPETALSWLAPKEIGRYKEGIQGSAESVFAFGNIALVSNYGDGGYLMNITDRGRPKKLCDIDPSESVKHMEFVNDLLYVAESTEGISIFNIEILKEPIRIGNFSDYGSGSAYSFSIREDIIFVADGTDGLEILNVTDPANIYEIGQFDNGGRVHSVTTEGNLAFVSDFEDGLEILDISDLSAPVLIGNYSDGGNVLACEIDGDRAFIADNYEGMVILNISDPTHPIKIGQFHLEDETYRTMHLDYVEPYIYLANGKGGISFLDISDVDNIIQINSYFDQSGHGHGIHVYDGLIFVADDTDGLEIIDPGKDSDDDGVSNYEEIKVYSTNEKDSDTDADGLDDYSEIFIYETNPNLRDSDSDGFSDFEEINELGSDPLSSDTDGDGINDYKDWNPLSFLIPTGIGIGFIGLLITAGIFGILFKQKMKKKS